MHPTSKLIWILSLLVLVAGCRGCSQDDKKAEADKQKKKLRLVSDELRTLPFSKEIVGNSVKPGHWYQTRHKLKANQNDESMTATLYQIDRKDRPTSVWEEGIPIQFERDISLAKGQEKTIEMKVLQTPPFLEQDSDIRFTGKPAVSILMRYSQRGIGSPILDEAFITRTLKDYQYDMLILSRNLPNHIFWRGLDCIVWPLFESDDKFKVNPHRIIDISEEEIVESLPSQLMTMTSISHMVINDVSLNNLPQSQQDAILDWLHFGGTIILNGPEALAGIETSFLKDYAPIQKTISGELSQEHIDRLNDPDRWCIRFYLQPFEPSASHFKPRAAIPILQGQLGPDSAWIPGLDGLVAERSVGQGRIVMTSFPMNHPSFVNWPSYSSLIHNGILRKPKRDVKLDKDGIDLTLKYSDAQNEGREVDVRLNTRLRMWARDLESRNAKLSPDNPPNPTESPKPSSTYGSWNSKSLVTNRAHSYLKNLSGISVPNLSSILKWLGLYLLVLVPLNWLVFRLIGRLELAWLAAPLIAIAGVFVIAKAVQLDVGFSRSQTSMQLIELHNGYPRGILSSYHALYSSLTTNYKIVYPQGEGIVSPMPQHRQRSLTGRSGMLPYRIADENGSGFQAFPVLSNTIGLVQSEEIVSLDGSVSWTIDEKSHSYEVSNQTKTPIHDVVLLGFSKAGLFHRADIGTLRAGDNKAGNLLPPSPKESYAWKINTTDDAQKNENSSKNEQDNLKLEETLREIIANYPLQLGEWIAVGRTDTGLSKLQISPATSQVRSSTLLLMHAAYPQLGEIEHDLRLMPRTQPSAQDESNQ